MDHHDVVIVGARVAGAATGMLLARAGHNVLVLDRARPGSDTQSTHALLRPAVVQLERWGLLERIVAAGTPPLSTVVFRYDDVPVTVAPREPLWAPRRTVLDPLLVDAAREAGADVRFGVDVRGLLRDPTGRVSGVVVRHRDGRREEVGATTVVGADGRGSRVAAAVEAPVTHRGDTASGVVYGYWSGLVPDRLVWAFTAGSAAGAIPTDDGLTCVFAAVPAADFGRCFARDRVAGLDSVLRRTSPTLADRVGGGVRRGPVRGFPGLPSLLRRPHGDGWALVGDAGYWKDPATAHGISDALRDAELLACALDRTLRGAEQATTLRGYELLRDELSRPFLDVTDRIAGYDWDVPEAQQLHRRMSQTVDHEVAAIGELPPSASWATASPGLVAAPGR